jgi:hypothetical protein
VQLRYVKGIVSTQTLLNLRHSQGLQLLLDIHSPSVLLFISPTFTHIGSTIQLSARGLPKSSTQPCKRLALPLFA